MKFCEYRHADNELRGRLARTNTPLFYALEIVRFGGAMALVLAIGDMLPLPLSLWEGEPIKRFVFILGWAIAMTIWHRNLVLQATKVGSVEGQS